MVAVAHCTETDCFEIGIARFEALGISCGSSSFQRERALLIWISPRHSCVAAISLSRADGSTHRFAAAALLPRDGLFRGFFGAQCS